MEEEQFIYYDIELVGKYQESQIMLSMHYELLIWDLLGVLECSLSYTRFYLN